MTWLKYIALLAYCLILTSCTRRELTYDTQEGIPFGVTLDWSALASGDEQPYYLKALFFPVDGGRVVERYLSPDSKELRVPVGEYRVIIYNWRTNAQAQTVQFRGDTYDTFEAYITPRSSTLSSRGGELHVMPAPDGQLYGWNTGTGTLVVSATSPVVSTRGSAGSGLTVPMQRMVHSYVMAIHVKNAQYVSSITALLTDARGSLPLGEGEYSKERYAVETAVVRSYNDSDMATYYCRVTTFGLFDDTRKRLIVNIVNSGGDSQQRETDVTTPVEKVDRGEVPPDTPQVVIPREDPIEVIIPENIGGGGGFVPPTVGDWEDEKGEIIL